VIRDGIAGKVPAAVPKALKAFWDQQEATALERPQEAPVRIAGVTPAQAPVVAPAPPARSAEEILREAAAESGWSVSGSGGITSDRSRLNIIRDGKLWVVDEGPISQQIAMASRGTIAHRLIDEKTGRRSCDSRERAAKIAARFMRAHPAKAPDPIVWTTVEPMPGRKRDPWEGILNRPQTADLLRMSAEAGETPAQFFEMASMLHHGEGLSWPKALERSLRVAKWQAKRAMEASAPQVAGSCEVASRREPSEGTTTRQAVFERFRELARKMWRNYDSIDALVSFDPSKEPDRTASSPIIYAAILADGRQRSLGDLILHSSSKYVLQLHNELLSLKPDVIDKILLHEAGHLGINNHGEEFRKMVVKNGGSVSFFAAVCEDGKSIRVEIKEGARFKTIRTFPFDREAEATAWVRQERMRVPGKYRLPM
jgi:hypothetical protein